MKAALEELGIPTWHYVTMTENPPDMAMWKEALEAKYAVHESVKPFDRTDFDSLLSDWGATTDQPAHFLAEELINAYPEAKIVLVERAEDSWYRSYDQTVIKGAASPLIPFLTLFDRTYIGQMADLVDLIAHHYFQVNEPRTYYYVFNNPRFFSQWRERAKDRYAAHNAMVKRVVPRERLLLFKLEEGWEPLCKFLGKPIPEVPFPKVNETAAVQEKINLYIAEGYKRSIIAFAKRTAPMILLAIAVILSRFLYRTT